MISSRDDLKRALRLRRPPDAFELRLDCLRGAITDLYAATADFVAPLIVTARHPAEGGVNNLAAAKRRDMLERFLPHAAYIDVELRSATKLGAILRAAASSRVRRIISVHDLRQTPNTRRLHELALAAEDLGADIFKIATRVDTDVELARLLDLLDAVKSRMPISAMGMGRLGRMSRIQLARRGSALNYVYLVDRQSEGQLSLRDMRRVLNR